MRHPLPFIAAGMTLLTALVASGAGLMHLLGAVWPFWVGLGLGVALPTSGLWLYWQADETVRRRIYHRLWVAWCMETAFVVGAMPGGLVGHAVAGDMGQMIGYFTTAVVFAGLAGWWAYVRGPQGRRAGRRVDRD